MSDHLLQVLLLTVWLGGTVWSSTRKGYNPLFFAIGGVFSLLVLSFLPFTNRNQPPTRQDVTRRVRGNWIGLTCSLATGLAVMPAFLMR